MKLKSMETIKFGGFGMTDMFAIPVSLFATRRKQYSGSLVGSVLTSVVMIGVTAFIVA